jgi:hypothetical protein
MRFASDPSVNGRCQVETRNPPVAIGLVFFLAFVLIPTIEAQTTFNPECNPFQSLETKHPIDTKCASAAGNAQPAASGHALQNLAKNNFCAAGQVVDIAYDTLIKLQRAAESVPGYAGWNRNNLPPSRDPFTHLAGTSFKEGMLVRFTGFIYELHAADTTGGESVNCNINGSEANDIHIAFVANPADAECLSITAEMSPHLRPKAWVASKMAPKVALFVKKRPNPSGKRLSRVTGQLMFDAAHKPCAGGQRGSSDPARASDWEVHPVYAMEVCKTLGTTCAETDWQPLDQFLGTTSATGTKRRTSKPH